ncbi:hypothetical protein A0H81_08495 [Grifola frondosa]|uniref:RPAP1/MINIYO-like TPR repeats domain-containing protein n=1 Tax=Grifola frondosa TaxID=5627 RepID=A0A1C7M3J0_GRIFR|nr:hypothetical protein A0H81_08495 [Grifola frondosa]
MVFGCMKVFMLEHGQQENNSAEEVFRDGVVGQFMTELLSPFTSAASPSSLSLPPPPPGPDDGLDVVATRFLSASTPFYQYYTDFVGLYDAISFAHPLFASLLLPPTSMRYLVDYRKYLWADYNHVLRTVRTSIGAVVAGSVGEYLWPAETDADVTGAYLRALVRGPLEGFVRLGATGETASKLLMGVVDQGNLDVIREVVLYRQVREGTALIPPACFEQSGDWKAFRFANTSTQ